ncbi:phosphopantetheine-binding protein [Erwinia endophytica]|uniref:phosphopantetheine-binding protein n=1 Tax=Erwinia endophytica TaxID=1563158 RepID=UPI00186B9588|nr:phosphopantetheine-binding protein [Erwinia endophytica]
MNKLTDIPAFSADDLRNILHEKLDMSDGGFGEDENLFDYGLNSVDLMALVAHLHTRGLKVSFIDLAIEPTFNAWRKQLGL